MLASATAAKQCDIAVAQEGVTEEETQGGTTGPGRNQQDSTPSNAPIIAAVITGAFSALVAIATIFVSIFISGRGLRYTLGQDIGKVLLDLKIRQLNELYTPLSLLLQRNKNLFEKIQQTGFYSGGDVQGYEGFRRDLPDILKKDPPAKYKRAKPVVVELLGNNHKIKELIDKHGGLAVYPGPPESFELFLSHYDALSLAKQRKPVPDAPGYKPSQTDLYPQKLHEDVEQGRKKIINTINDLENKYNELHKELERKTGSSWFATSE